MKILPLLTILILFPFSNSIAREGGFKGTAQIEMKLDHTICITIKPEGLPAEKKCFEKSDKDYDEIKERIKDLKPGEVKELTDENC